MGSLWVLYILYCITICMQPYKVYNYVYIYVDIDGGFPTQGEPQITQSQTKPVLKPMEFLFSSHASESPSPRISCCPIILGSNHWKIDAGYLTKNWAMRITSGGICTSLVGVGHEIALNMASAGSTLNCWLVTFSLLFHSSRKVKCC